MNPAYVRPVVGCEPYASLFPGGSERVSGNSCLIGGFGSGGGLGAPVVGCEPYAAGGCWTSGWTSGSDGGGRAPVVGCEPCSSTSGSGILNGTVSPVWSVNSGTSFGDGGGLAARIGEGIRPSVGCVPLSRLSNSLLNPSAMSWCAFIMNRSCLRPCGAFSAY